MMAARVHQCKRARLKGKAVSAQLFLPEFEGQFTHVSSGAEFIWKLKQPTNSVLFTQVSTPLPPCIN